MALAVLLTENFDLDFTGGGPRMTKGLEAARGALGYRFNTQAGTGQADPGEWVYNYAYGVLWRQAVFGRYFSTDETQALLAGVASQTTGVQPTAAYQVALEYVPSTRQQHISITRLRTDSGQTANDTLTIAVTS